MASSNPLESFVFDGRSRALLVGRGKRPSAEPLDHHAEPLRHRAGPSRFPAASVLPI